MIIDSKFSVLDPKLDDDFSDEMLKNEPMLFNCDLNAALRIGGPLTHEVLEVLPRGWRDVPLVIDSRVHMLMPGWYPCIPGWHHDDVPRTRSDGQPNYEEGQNRSQHIFCLFNGDICPTAMAEGAADFKMPELGKVIYSEWHRDVEAMIIDDFRGSSQRLVRSTAPSGRLIQMDDRTWHTGSRAVKNGWRFFIRISRYFDPDGKPIQRGNARTNELRRQVQVYMDNPNAGW